MNQRSKQLTLTTLLLITVVISTGCIQETPINDQLTEAIEWEKPQPPSVNATKMEMLVHNLINEERTKEGLERLQWNQEIAAVAREHSEYLANIEQNHGFTQEIYISHTGKDGKQHDHRIEKNEVYYINGSGENVAGISAVEKYYPNNNTPSAYINKTQIAQRAVTGWMNSPGHRKNILTETFEETGIGIATDPTGTNYILTQVFINRANCGYRYGECCENRGCFVGLTCMEETCLPRED